MARGPAADLRPFVGADARLPAGTAVSVSCPFGLDSLYRPPNVARTTLEVRRSPPRLVRDSSSAAVRDTVLVQPICWGTSEACTKSERTSCRIRRLSTRSFPGLLMSPPDRKNRCSRTCESAAAVRAQKVRSSSCDSHGRSAQKKKRRRKLLLDSQLSRIVLIIIV